MPAWIDTHCHLDAAEFDGERDAVRERARAAGVAQCVLPAVAASNFAGVQVLARRWGDACALGIHPLYTPQARPEDLEVLDAALQHATAQHMSPVVAVGEIGLDHFVAEVDPARQRAFYTEQLGLARRHGLPVILHVRRSADALLRELRRWGGPGGIAHAFNGSLQQAHAFIDLGFRLGFGGTVTYERSLQIRRLATQLPLSALVLETDAPDIPPQWLHRPAAMRAAGVPAARNEPAQLPRIGGVLARLRGIDEAELAQATRANAFDALPRLGVLNPVAP